MYTHSESSVAIMPAASAVTRTSLLRSAGISKMMIAAVSGVKVMTVRKGKVIYLSQQPGHRGVDDSHQPRRPDADDDQQRHQRRHGDDLARRNLQPVP